MRWLARLRSLARLVCVCVCVLGLLAGRLDDLFGRARRGAIPGSAFDHMSQGPSRVRDLIRLMEATIERFHQAARST